MIKNKKHFNFDYDNMIDYSQELFCHGTSNSLSLSVLLSPSLTGRLREDWRQKTLDKIILTNSLKSAQMHAKKAIVRFGVKTNRVHCKTKRRYPESECNRICCRLRRNNFGGLTSEKANRKEF